MAEGEPGAIAVQFQARLHIGTLVLAAKLVLRHDAIAFAAHSQHLYSTVKQTAVESI